MTEHKLDRYLRKNSTLVLPAGSQILTPVILTDSKAKYLRNVGSLPLENNIKWWFKSGQTSDLGLNWLRSNLDNKIGQLDNISLYVWLGTCDLTFKTNDTVDIRENPKEAIDNLIRNFEDIVTLIQGYPVCKVTFLEIPVYSIYLWNKAKEHPDPRSFISKDNTLISHILDANHKIRALNNRLSVRSPGLNNDVYHPITCHTKNKHKRARDLYNFNLYRDGIHPKELLAKVWLRKIIQRIRIDCW
jgi:hypothetical protein